jgi:broad specificity phosphatase PhoE
MLWVLRHGRSLANEAGVVVSRLENGVLDKYALAPEGVLQAAAAGQALAAALHEAGLTAADVRLVASPFSRTLQTARAVATQLGLPESAVEAEDALRERFFGTPAELGDHRRGTACGRAC